MWHTCMYIKQDVKIQLLWVFYRKFANTKKMSKTEPKTLTRITYEIMKLKF